MMKFKCSYCGETHDEWPAIAFKFPDHYSYLSDQDKDEIAEISNDFCVITHPDQTDRFIRCTLTQKVNDHCEDLEYGLWVSLSESSFNDYDANYETGDYEKGYFGWLSNNIDGYEFHQPIPMNVFTRPNGERPYLVPQDNFDHPFVKDYYNGITKEDAEQRIATILNNAI